VDACTIQRWLKTLPTARNVLPPERVSSETRMIYSYSINCAGIFASATEQVTCTTSGLLRLVFIQTIAATSSSLSVCRLFILKVTGSSPLRGELFVSGVLCVFFRFGPLASQQRKKAKQKKRPDSENAKQFGF
jgi:hypothetical protein